MGATTKRMTLVITGMELEGVLYAVIRRLTLHNLSVALAGKQ